MDEAREVDSLRPADLEAQPVWEFVNDDGAGERLVRPVRPLPAGHLEGRVVGTRVRLASGGMAWALVGNVDAQEAWRNEHFLTLSLERGARWFHLARYHDPDWAERGPDALATVLGLPVESVFPISYDLSPHARGRKEALVGTVDREPRVKLTRAEIIALAVG